jgi:flagellum-specific ATP synthase
VTSCWQNSIYRLQQKTSIRRGGQIIEVKGLTLVAEYPGAFIGERCNVLAGIPMLSAIPAKVVGFVRQHAVLMLLSRMNTIRVGAQVVSSDNPTLFHPSEQMLGRVLDPLGRALDNGTDLTPAGTVPFVATISPLSRAPIEQPFVSGIRTLDSLMTLGLGQRIGIFANAGVGKSSLLNQICEYRAARDDLIVYALIGERGREVQDCYQRLQKSNILANSVLICATADQPALMRIEAMYSALTAAEYFSHKGRNVTLVVDSITRFAMALRDVGLAAGEPPTIRGYTSSVFSALPEVIERCGAFLGRGAITGLFSVLVEGELQQDPAADALKAVLDGHLVLSAALAEREHYPAIDIAKSVSRLFGQLSTLPQRQASRRLRQVWATYEEQKNLLALGLAESEQGQQLLRDVAKLKAFLQQDSAVFVSDTDSLKQLLSLELETAS